jgi:hypothetical protein
MKKRYIVSGLLSVLVAFSVNGGDEITFKESDIEFDGTAHDRLLADFNGDGKTDIGVQYTISNKEDQYFFYIFFQQPGGSFRSKPDISLTFPEDARLFDAGDVAPAPGEEMVLLRDQGMFYYEKADNSFGALKPVFHKENLLTGSEPSRPLYQRFLWDIDKRGYDEIVFPTEKGPEIYKRGEEGYKLFQKINLPVVLTFRVGGLGDIMTTDDINQFLRFLTYGKRITANLTIPDIFVEDADGDGILDILGLLKNRLKIFCQRDDGSFPDKPTVVIERQIMTPEEKKLSFAGQGMTFSDLNGDGIIDIIMTKWGSTENRSQMTRYIYYGKKGLRFNEGPDQIITSASAIVDFGMYDLNGDGRKDLLIPYFHFAPSTAFKMMTENKIKIQFRLYLMGPDGRYSQGEGKEYARPDERKIINYKVDVIGIILDFQTLIEGKFHPLISFGYDFNGDGYPDIAADTGADKLEFFWGTADAKYPRMPDQVKELESAIVYDIGDFNNDKRADIITYYESEERVKEKRKIAKEAYLSGQTDIEPEIKASALLATKEQTRIKALVSE